MANIIIPVTKSLTVTNKFPEGNINTEIISIGNDGEYFYKSYLFFDTSSIPNNISIFSAELILFKTCDFFDDKSIAFYVCPLLDFFSTYTTYKNCPEIYSNFRKKFSPFTKKISVEINITHIVRCWSNMSLPNKGLFLSGSYKKTSFTSFCSALNNDNNLIPILYISYIPEPNITNINIENINMKRPIYPKPSVSNSISIKPLES